QASRSSGPNERLDPAPRSQLKLPEEIVSDVLARDLPIGRRLLAQFEAPSEAATGRFFPAPARSSGRPANRGPRRRRPARDRMPRQASTPSPTAAPTFYRLSRRQARRRTTNEGPED